MLYDVALVKRNLETRRLRRSACSLMLYSVPQATFQGFPHPIIEDMMAHSALARKKLPPGALSHVSIDVGRFFAQAYGLGLSKGAK